MSSKVKSERRVSTLSRRRRITNLFRTEYNFDKINYFELYEQSELFRQLVNSGKYIYVNGHIVLCDKHIIQIDNGKFTLTKSSNVNLTQYCASFYRTYSAGPSAAVGMCAHFCYNPTRRTHTKAKNAEKEADFESLAMEDIIHLSGGEFGMYPTFQAEFNHQMKEHGITNEKLSELTGISEKTISRMRSEEGYKPRLPYIVAVCVGMHLNTAISRRLIFLAGESLDKPNPTERERFFIAFINVFYKQDVRSCNRLMLKHNQKPLTPLT